MSSADRVHALDLLAPAQIEGRQVVWAAFVPVLLLLPLALVLTDSSCNFNFQIRAILLSFLFNGYRVVKKNGSIFVSCLVLFVKNFNKICSKRIHY